MENQEERKKARPAWWTSSRATSPEEDAQNGEPKESARMQELVPE